MINNVLNLLYTNMFTSVRNFSETSKKQMKPH